VSSNRKRNRSQPRRPQGSRAKLLAVPIITLVVGIALIIQFSGVLDRSTKSSSPPQTDASAPLSPASTTQTLAPVQVLDPFAPNPASSADDRAAEFVNHGTDLFQQGKYEEAAASYAKAVELTPDDETAHFNLASALARLGKTGEAKKSYLEALRLFPDYSEAHNNLGNLLGTEGQFADAMRHLEAAIKLDPDSASAHNNLGTVLMRQGKFTDATSHFADAVRLMPDYVEARCNLGNSLLGLGKAKEAETEFQAALTVKSDFEPARRGLLRVAQFRAAVTDPPSPLLTPQSPK
jgi:Flp pilus assembly protein TadD